MPKTNTDHDLITAAIIYARSLTRNLPEAEDLAQQAWLKLSRKYGKIENRALLYRAVRNLFYDQLRRARIVQFTPLETAPETGKSESYGVGLDMQTAMDHLSENERSSLFLNVVEGYTALEISKLLGMPRGTILSHMSRARGKLRKLLGSEMGVEQLATA